MKYNQYVLNQLILSAEHFERKLSLQTHEDDFKELKKAVHKHIKELRQAEAAT